MQEKKIITQSPFITDDDVNIIPFQLSPFAFPSLLLSFNCFIKIIFICKDVIYIELINSI